jgi:23S rRNA (cytidine1920-2'-O)/16S rRNA (cytidine1409-2'-O)-methyltransferase
MARTRPTPTATKIFKNQFKNLPLISTMRADQLLVHRGLAQSRSQAVRLIDAGARWQLRGEWKPLRKSDDVPDDAQIELQDAAEAKYVSRGGLKLEGALQKVGVQVQGKLCLDVGQSTGGFTDCLLQHGALAVLGVDVGHGQLHARLRADPRVVCMERVNARELNAIDLIAACAHKDWAKGQFDMQNQCVDVCVGDVSFISQTLLLPALTALLKPGAHLLMLVKPQFELQPEHIGKGGLVKDAAHYALVEQRIRQAYPTHGLQVKNYFDSPIAGGDGNREFFVHAVKD